MREEQKVLCLCYLLTIYDSLLNGVDRGSYIPFQHPQGP